MARNSPDNSCEEDEALSLCDLPLGHTENSISRNLRDDDPDPPETGEEQEFEFGSWVGSVPAEKEMCSADELFFKGQILPLRLSSIRDGSGSESMDHSSGLTSTSSRSSSLNSTTSTSSASVASIAKTTPFYAFQTHPSPKPQIRASGGSRRSKKSSVWNLFRVGLVPTPEIGLQDLKARNGNKSSGRGHNGKNGPTRKLKNLNLSDTKEGDKGMRMRFSDKNGGFLRGCKCSVETVSSSVKGTTRGSGKKGCGGEGTSRALQRQEVKSKKTIKQKHDVSRRRASDWLKELSHANSPRHDETVALLA